jgi:hypothetical protein
MPWKPVVVHENQHVLRAQPKEEDGEAFRERKEPGMQLLAHLLSSTVGGLHIGMADDIRGSS